MVAAAVPVFAQGWMLGGKLESPKVSTPGVRVCALARRNGSMAEAAEPARTARRETDGIILFSSFSSPDVLVDQTA
jgi:hypothetical protein